MSSHREAPQISKDPAADSTDVYAFVSPDKPTTTTLIANYIPLQEPAGGPNFYEFDDDVLYAINIDNTGDGNADISYQWRFTTVNANPRSFLYNTGPIQSLTDNNWNRRQTYSLTKVTYGVNGRATSKVLKTGLPAPPCNIGPLSTPDYTALVSAAIQTLPSGETVFAGQRAEGFYVDLGSVFDLGDLRPFASEHNHYGLSNFPTSGPGVNATKNLNVHSLAIQVPTAELTGAAGPTIGVWTTASRQKVKVTDGNPSTGQVTGSGPFTQVSRLGNPLANEVLVGIGDKDYWNSVPPTADGSSRLVGYFQNPTLGQLLPVLYPGVFPNLDAWNKSGKGRPDIEAIFLTGLPVGLVPGLSTTISSSPARADMLRLNTSVPPTTTNPSIYGVLGGDNAGFPNGRRVFDDVVAIELRALAGTTLHLVANYTPDAAASAVTDGLTPADLDVPYLSTFPYLGTPHSGYTDPSS